MIRRARIVENVVVEILRPITGFAIEDCFAAEFLDGCVPVGEQIQQGWVVTADGFAPPSQPPPSPLTKPVPASISDRQFAHGLWKQNVITLEEAKAFVKVGEMPPSLAALIGGLPAEMRDDAELLLSGATIFERAHPFTDVIASTFGWSEEATDDFWRFAAAL